MIQKSGTDSDTLNDFFRSSGQNLAEGLSHVRKAGYLLQLKITPTQELLSTSNLSHSAVYCLHNTYTMHLGHKEQILVYVSRQNKVLKSNQICGERVYRQGNGGENFEDGEKE